MPSPHEQDDFTLGQAEALAEALIPRFKDAMRPEVLRLENKIDRLNHSINRHRSSARLWGAATGAIAGFFAGLMRGGH